MLQNSRQLQGIGAQCYNLFDCSGSLNCCTGIGPQNQNFCYPVCDRAAGASCHEQARCSTGHYCCNQKCVASSGYSSNCQAINVAPQHVAAPSSPPITIPPAPGPTTTSTTVTSQTESVTNNPRKPVVIVDSSASYYDKLASLNYNKNLQDTQNNINNVLHEIQRLEQERKELENESNKADFLAALAQHEAKLQAELDYLRKQYNEIEQIKTAVYNNQNIGAPQAVAQAASEVKCADEEGNTIPCENGEIEAAAAAALTANLEDNVDQKTQLANVGDGTFSDSDFFDGLSNVGVIVVSIVAGLVLLVLLASILYCFRRKKKGKTSHRNIEMKNDFNRNPTDGPPTPKMRSHQLKNDQYTTHSIFVNDTNLGPQETQGGVAPKLFYDEAPDILHMQAIENQGKKRNNMH